MIASEEYKRVYREISLLIDDEKYAEAYVIVGELRDFATSRKQLIQAAETEDFLMEKLNMSEPKRN